jgi:hypothetical protein
MPPAVTYLPHLLGQSTFFTNTLIMTPFFPFVSSFWHLEQRPLNFEMGNVFYIMTLLTHNYVFSLKQCQEIRSLTTCDIYIFYSVLLNFINHGYGYPYTGRSKNSLQTLT